MGGKTEMLGEPNTITSDLSISTAFGVLANQRRRYVLASLQEHDWPIALADMGYEVAARERGKARTEIPAEEAKRVCTSLRHVHIPKLVETGIIKHNQDRGTVTLAENAEQLAPYVEQATVE